MYRKNTSTFVCVAVSILLVLVAGCREVPLSTIRGYQPLAEIATDGFLNNNKDYDKYNEKKVAVWGYADIINSSLDQQSEEEELFFSIKPRYENATGESVKAVCLGKKQGYNDFFAKLEKNGEFSAEKIFVKGQMLLHRCPTNFHLNYCPVLQVSKPDDIRFSSDFPDKI
jgi:hypothetical protein